MKSMSASLRKTTLALAVTAGIFSAAAYAGAPAAHATPVKGPAEVNPYSPAFKHAYRHGVIPTRQVQAAMKRWSTTHLMATDAGLATSSNTLYYRGGTGAGGVGVMSGQNKAYIVFYGSQWGTQTTDSNGDMKFSNDTAGAAGAAQEMFKGIGTNSETWQNDLTQWCNGAASGATSCAAGLTRIPRQTNILAGVWYDNSVASPSAATGTQLAQEAVKAAAHFGNTATGSNRSTYYMILSPKGTNPDNYQGQYCAWHDYTGDGYGVTAPGGDLAFSNQPYNIDSGAGCGVGFVNSPGTLDGFTMTLGHEWHEMMSDQFPAGGWTANSGYENSDECAWLSPGSTGGAANITFSTGTFAQQASWSNDTNSCAISHADVSGGGGNNPPTANFTDTTSGLTATFTDSSTDSDGTIASRAWDFGDASSSTATNPTHTYAAAGTYTVSETVTDDGGLTDTHTASVTVGNVSNLLQNGVAVTGLAATTGNQLNYLMNVPAGATGLAFVQSGGTGDSDMYVKFGVVPTLSSYDCRPYVNGNAETCSIGTVQTGTYYVMLNAYSSFTGVSLMGSYTAPATGATVLSNGVPVVVPAIAKTKFSGGYKLRVPAHKTSLTFTISGGTGDADLYVRFGHAPGRTAYDCRPRLTGNEETCTYTNPVAGTYYVKLLGYKASSGVTLTGTYTP